MNKTTTFRPSPELSKKIRMWCLDHDTMLTSTTIQLWETLLAGKIKIENGEKMKITKSDLIDVIIQAVDKLVSRGSGTWLVIRNNNDLEVIPQSYDNDISYKKYDDYTVLTDIRNDIFGDAEPQKPNTEGVKALFDLDEIMEKL